MMYLRLRATVSLFLLALPTVSSAAIVTATVSGPGGSGTVQKWPLNVGFTNYTYPKLSFTSMDYLDVHITADSAGSYTIREILSTYTSVPPIGPLGKEIINNTGVDWSGFQITSLDDTFAAISSITNPGGQFSVIDTNDQIGLLTDGVISGNGGILEITIKVDIPSAGTFTIRQLPLAVPEASTLVLVGLTALFCSLSRFILRRRAA